MKRVYQHILTYSLMRFFMWLILGIGLAIPSNAQSGNAQSMEEMQKDTAGTEKEKAPLRMSFEVSLINDSIKLMGRVRSKVGSKFQNTSGIEVHFYLNEINSGNLVGKDMSNAKGEAVVMMASRSISGDSVPAVFWASVQDNPTYADVQETVSIPFTIMEMELIEEDSVRLAKVFIGDPDAAGHVSPLPGIECKVYIKRLFGLLQVGDEQTTDEEGMISVEIPQDIRGDESGKITIVSIVPNHEVLGTVEVSKTINWGIPVKVDDFYRQKELWSARSNSPVILILMVNAVLVGIWTVICFIFLQIIRINRIGRARPLV